MLANIARDHSSVYINVRQRAKSFVDKLFDADCMPFLSLTNVHELLAIEDKKVIQNRLDWLRQLPSMSWIESLNLEKFPDQTPFGMHFDIFCWEIETHLQNSHLSMRDLRDLVQQRRRQHGSGAIAISKIENDLDDHIKLANITLQLNRKATSIKQTKIFELPDTIKLRDLQGKPLPSRESIQAKENALEESLNKELETQADPNLLNLKSVAESFIHELPVSEIVKQCHDKLDVILFLGNYQKNDVNLDMSLKEFGEWSQFQQFAKTILKQFRPTLLNRVLDIEEAKIPSWMIYRNFQRYSQPKATAVGSDLNDIYLCFFLPYVDVGFVDKRTKANLDIICGKDNRLSSLVGDYRRTSDYWAIDLAVEA